MSVITHALTQTCTVIQSTVNAYGEQEHVSEEDVACRVREITALEQGATGEQETSDAMAWFEADADIQEATLFREGGETYRVQEVTKARRLGSSDVLFLKCLVEKHTEVEGE